MYPSNPNISHGRSIMWCLVGYQMYPCDEAGLGEDQDLTLDKTLGWAGQGGESNQYKLALGRQEVKW